MPYKTKGKGVYRKKKGKWVLVRKFPTLELARRYASYLKATRGQNGRVKAN